MDLNEVHQAGELACPDGAVCHHGCGGMGSCFRVRTCEPMSNVFPNDEWPAHVLARVTLTKAQEILSFYAAHPEELSDDQRAALNRIVVAHAMAELEKQWVPAEHGVPALFIGGEYDGQVLGVANFKEDATPRGYESMTTFWRRHGSWTFEEGIPTEPPMDRFEVVFADGPPTIHLRIHRVLGCLAEKVEGLLQSNA